MMTIREYKRAESLEEAWQLNQKKPNRILGGMIWLKMETINVGTAIDLSGLGLDTIEENEEGFSIGAMVTLRQLEQHPGLAAYTHGAMRETVRHIVGVQLRNLATVGGSIYSRFGFSDVLTMFLAMDCDVELYKGGILPLHEYAQRPYDRDVLVRLIVKKDTDAALLPVGAQQSDRYSGADLRRCPVGDRRLPHRHWCASAARCAVRAPGRACPCGRTACRTVCGKHKGADRYRLQYARQRRVPQASGRRADKARGAGTGTA